ncbi:MAG: ABC transporter substrate-binding protein [Candidatus Woesearchaeota archaeon]|nr:ABC transporter substrate-binding protein [Candidatus Woesearchaeota archaeon]
MNKKHLGIIGIIIVILIGIFIFNSTTKTEEIIKIGVTQSLSGSAAYYGQENMKGVEIAKEEISKDYPTFNFKVFHEDSFFTAKGGVDSYKKMREIDNIEAIITHASSVSLAVQPLAQNDKILQMAVSASALTYSTPNDLSFRTSPTTNVEAKTIADYIIKKGYKKVSILYMNNEIGVSITESLKKELKDKDATVMIISEEGFLTDETDFKASLLKIKESDANIVFIPALASNILLILKQAKEIDLEVQFIGFRSTEDANLINNAGELAEGIIYSYGFDPHSELSQVKRFVNAYREKYGKNPDGFSAEAYEGFKLVTLAFINCGKDNQCIQNYLTNLKEYNSVFGNLSFDSNGDVYYDFFMKTVKNGKFTRLE